MPIHSDHGTSHRHVPGADKKSYCKENCHFSENIIYFLLLNFTRLFSKLVCIKLANFIKFHQSDVKWQTTVQTKIMNGLSWLIIFSHSIYTDIHK